MNKVLLSALLICQIGFSVAQEVLLKVQDKTISKEDFVAVYQKNNTDNKAITKADLDEYLELYINFQLKVLEAESLGLDTSASFSKEFNRYKKQLTDSYLTDKEVTEFLVQEAYERLQKEVNASHILLQVNADALPEDTLAVYKKIVDLKNRVDNGEDFEALAKEFSEDPSAKKNGGNLGYFTAMRMVYPFETAAYNTPVGQVSNPVRSRFGYHIIKVNDIRPATGQWKAAHIMIKTPKDTTVEKYDEKLATAKKLIAEIKEKVDNGEDFEMLARTYSDDPGSRRQGGVLPWFKSNTYPKAFEDVCFALDSNGQVSEPFRTSYGFHIVKRLDKRDLDSFEKMEGEIRRNIKRDSRSKLSKEKTLSRLKEEYNYTAYDKNLKFVYNAIDTTYFVGKWDPASVKKTKKPLFTLGDKKFTLGDFVTYLNQFQTKTRRTDLKPMVYKFYKEWVENSIIEEEKSNLSTKYPEYRRLLEEYRNGILLFDLMEQKVWNEAVNDSIGLKAFHEENKNNYKWDDRLDAQVFVCESLESAKKVEELLKQGADIPAILEAVNTEKRLMVRVREGKYEKKDEEILEKIEWKKGVAKLTPMNNKFYVVNVLDTLPAQPKLLKEIKGAVIADYQNYLDQQWIEELRSKYTFEVNQEVLNSLIQ